MEQLPYCEAREEMVQTNGGELYACSHPKLTGDQLTVLVRPETCMDCEYVKWSPANMIIDYSPKKYHASKEVFGERVGICNTCDIRQGNWCSHHGGCGLSKALKRPAFECPEKKFKKV